MVVESDMPERDSTNDPKFGDVSITSTGEQEDKKDSGYSVKIDTGLLADKAVTAAITGVASAIATKAILEDK